MNIFITGAAGYVGGMLAELFLKDPRVSHVTALDMRDTADKFPKNDPRFSWVTANLGDDGWEAQVLEHGIPDVVVHCAYVIRQGYGSKRAWQNKCNIGGATNMFNFVFKNNIKRLIHFSTVAGYGALATNTLAHHFVETDPLLEANYLYGIDKKQIEVMLSETYQSALAKKEATALPQIIIFRPCAISGPRGQFMFRRFGLLQMTKNGLPIIPLTGSQSARQFIHEDDVFDAVNFVAFGGIKGQYEIFNISPPGFLLLKDMAKHIGKYSIRIPMWLGKLCFAFLWHVSQGRIPTVPAGINSYTYPILVDGSKLARTGFKYRHSPIEALDAKVGRYT